MPAAPRPGRFDRQVYVPLPDVKVTTEPISLQPPAPQPAISLPTATRLQVIRGFLGPVNGGTLKVVDGPHVGVTGEVRAVDWGNLDDERR